MTLILERDRLVAWKSPLAPQELQQAVERMLHACGQPAPLRTVELSLVGDAAMEDANRRFLGCPGPTNVLSFPPADKESPLCLLINLDALERECLLYAQPRRTHLLRLLAHGLVHTLGHDHGPLMDALCDRAFLAARQAEPV